MMDWNWGTYDLVDPRVIVVDHRYQRPAKPTLIEKIAASPTPEAFGVILCFRRDNNVMYCIDGQQRLAAVLQIDKPPLLVPVLWYPAGSVTHEAEIFVRINEVRKG